MHYGPQSVLLYGFQHWTISSSKWMGPEPVPGQEPADRVTADCHDDLAAVLLPPRTPQWDIWSRPGPCSGRVSCWHSERRNNWPPHPQPPYRQRWGQSTEAAEPGLSRSRRTAFGLYWKCRTLTTPKSQKAKAYKTKSTESMLGLSQHSAYHSDSDCSDIW